METPDSTPKEPSATGSTGYPKADLVKRFLAILIDGIIVALIGQIHWILALVGAAYYVVRDGLDLDFMDQRSLGKKLMKLRPVTLDGGPMDLMRSVKRNWMWGLGGLAMIPILGWILIPVLALASFVIGIVEIVLVFTDADGRRWGDKIANTQVVEVAE
jgi:uncharacterized RDD family membrane protein YckC